MKRLKTLRLRFALWTAGLLFAALVLFGLFVYQNMSYSLFATVDETLRLTAIELGSEIKVRDGEPVFTENPIEDTQYTRLREQGFSVRLLTRTAQLLQAYGPYQALPRPQPALTDPDQPGELISVTDPLTQESVRVYSSSFVVDNRVVGLIQVAQNLNEPRRTLDLLLAALFIGGPLIVIIAGSGGYFLAARALAPIDKITRTALEISADDLSARLNLPENDDEVGRLSATFDSMLVRLEDAFQRERRFTADASHELRTPLSAMQTIISSILARRRDADEYEQALIDLSHETARMRTLAEGLLHLARTDATQPPARSEHVDLSILLTDVIDSLRPGAEDKGLHLVNEVPHAGLSIMGDGDGLIRMFVNLLNNAIKYTEHGHITISAEPQNGKLLAVTISDTGIGIRPEHLPHIFDRFYRVDGARSEEGIGLGLAIVKDVAQAHGGSVTVESKVGRGSTFVVQLSTQ